MLSWLGNHWWWIAGAIILMFAVVIYLKWRAWLIFLLGRSGWEHVTEHAYGVACARSVTADIVIATEDKPEWYEILEEELKRVPIGRIQFNPPEAMKVGVKERIEVRISRDPSADLVNALKGRGIPQIEKIKVSELMKVRVSSSDFRITPLNEEEQIIDSQGFSEWAWDVLPEKSGTKYLHLHVSIRVRLPFGEERKDHPVLDHKIIVKVNPIYSIGVFLSTYWKWIVTALVLPIIGLIWKSAVK